MVNKAVIEILGSREMKPFTADSEKEEIQEKDIFKHLFIWAVLMDRRELAMLFWKKEDKDFICSALYASALAKRLSENPIAGEHTDQLVALWASHRFYEDLAYSVMTEMYWKDNSLARQLLVTEVKRYNSTTVFEISEKFALMKFIGHAACQTKLNKIWKGHIFSETSTLKLAYMAMLVIFSMFVLTDLYPIPEKNPSVMEYMVIAWAVTTSTEEIRQALGIKQVSWNLMTWFSFWTFYEIVMYSLFITSVLLRLTLSANDFFHARMVYSLTLGLFIINSMQFFLVSKHIGPKVIMIGRMMFDIIFFVLIFAVFLFGFGVIYQATMFPNSEPGFQLFKDIVYMPYWQLYGELFLDNIAGKEPSTCTDDALLYRNGTLARCPEVNQINTLLLAVYMVVTHIILVNILIAMFSHTFTKVQDNNELVWKYHRFSLIREYYDRSSLIPPLIIISHIKKCVMCIACELFKKRETKNKFKISNKPESEQLAILERYSVYRHLNSSIRLRRYHATNTEAEKDGFDTSYTQEADISLEEQFDLLTSEVYKMQKNQEETMKDVKEIKSTKQNLLIIDLNGGSANRTYKI
ncbi:Hypothetical predicted protein [Mytilus galloprovincialis]|nr:Hypothetical predicted protein [Mytilus galloprovincialis]